MSKNSKNSTLLDNIIKILIILLLLGALFIIALFTNDKLQDKHSTKEANKKEKIVHTSITPSDTNKTQKKVYSQDEMQEIVQMMMDQMQELNKNSDNESTKLSIAATDDKSAYSELISTLEDTNIEDEDVMEINESSKSGIKAANNKDSVDHYNKVVIDSSIYSDENLDALSQRIGSIVDDIAVHKSSKTTYTQNISKEVETRVDEMRVIIVKRGDTLSKIALRAYGSVLDYDKLVEANRDLIKNPNHIYVGQRLRVPTL